MKTRDNLLAVGIALSVIALLVGGAYWFIASLIDKLNSVNSDVSKMVVGGGVAIIGSVVTLVGGKLWEQRIKIRQEIREKKIPVYEQQVATLFSAMFSAKTGQKQSEKQLEKAFIEFTEKLLIWGSSEVIEAWQAFRSHDWKNSAMDGFPLLERFILTLRKDIGNENSQLKDGDLLRLFISDYDVSIGKGRH